MAVTEGTQNLPTDLSGTRYFIGFYGTDSNFYIPRAIGVGNSAVGTLRVSNPLADFAIQHQPGVGSQATITQAAGAAGVKNVASAVSIGAFNTTAVALGQDVGLRDGASGVGTIKWAMPLSIPATAADTLALHSQTFRNPIPGTAATAMTLEFGVGTANTIQRVALVGMLVS